MKCEKCGYETNNKKSFSNHIRYGCKAIKWIQNKPCEYCGKKIDREKPKEQGRFCDHICYGLWRSENLKGEKAPSYKDGRCNERLLERARLPFKIWRMSVFQRDNYTCQKCGDNKGGNLEAHHIKSFALYPESRYDVGNGLTLCKKCHKETDNYGYTKKRTIKFRAWDKELKRMLDPKDIINLCGETTKELKEMSPYLILMQFTGLHDKNGKPIYEADRIKAGSQVFDVEYKYCSFGYNLYGEHIPITNTEHPNRNEVFEVIGNIYEDKQ